ncbi:T9SS type A sorting domain-containing protein [Chryseolinea soli]|uniref:T9SS C-terminal target domain-containing protein n=1 Tax=Chryseolinea soli TaxID=2321403 RepID=A0A385SY92_9BACT|nr:T9SS type A sorting domain-containing protein [Chryseolinea soli]AYB34710.1 T9SS C-terminal target domain-containing protein [Chryseolinea soli]
MKTFLLSAWLLLLSTTCALCAVTVTFKVNGLTSFDVPLPNGSSNMSYTIDMSKPHTQAIGDGWIYLYVKPANGTAVRLTLGEFVPASSWNPSGSNDIFSGSYVFGIMPGQLDYKNGVVYAQFEENTTGINTKSADVTARIPVYENIITAPSKTLFEGAGDPGAITGNLPKGGTGSYTYQWESSTTSSSSGYSNISGATSMSYDPPSFSAPTTTTTTYYRRKATSGGVTANSNVVSITKSPAPLANNTISYAGTATFTDSGDPTTISGSTPSGGSGSFVYQWQWANLANPSGFTDIAGATGQHYDPPAVSITQYFRRKVTSGGSSSFSNVITITIQRAGTTMANPIDLGNFNMCSYYSAMSYNFPEYGYGNEYGNQTDDVFHKFNLTAEAKVSIMNCKQDGVSGTIALLNASGNVVPYSAFLFSCDVGVELVYFLQPGVYYVVSEGNGGFDDTNYLPLAISAVPIFTTSSDVTIAAGNSTTLQAFGTGVTYAWSPATGLSSTTGASVVASPIVTTTYMVRAISPNGCDDFKYITVNVTGSPGSTFANPLAVNVGGCGYTSPFLDPTGYGNDYGGPSEDIYFKFTLASASEVSMWIWTGQNNLHLVLLNSAGTFVDEQYYSWVDSGDDAGTYVLVLTDGTPLKPTLAAGTYYLVVEGSNGNLPFGVVIETPTGYSCRKATQQTKESLHGGTQPATVASAETAGTLIEPETEESDATVYPNPVKDLVTLSFKQDGPATVHFMTSSGMSVKQATTEGKSPTINVSDLPTGLYLLKIVQGYSVYRKKLLIEK